MGIIASIGAALGGALAIGDTAGTILAASLVGAGTGAIGSAITGGNIGEGALFGGITGGLFQGAGDVLSDVFTPAEESAGDAFGGGLSESDLAAAGDGMAGVPSGIADTADASSALGLAPDATSAAYGSDAGSFLASGSPSPATMVLTPGAGAETSAGETLSPDEITNASASLPASSVVIPAGDASADAGLPSTYSGEPSITAADTSFSGNPNYTSVFGANESPTTEFGMGTPSIASTPSNYISADAPWNGLTASDQALASAATDNSSSWSNSSLNPANWFSSNSSSSAAANGAPPGTSPTYDANGNITGYVPSAAGSRTGQSGFNTTAAALGALAMVGQALGKSNPTALPGPSSTAATQGPLFNAPLQTTGALNRTALSPNVNYQTYGQGPEQMFFSGNNLTLPGAAHGGHPTGALSYADHAPQRHPFSTRNGDHHVQGAGDGTSDEVPALLSQDEYVLTARDLSALGNGSAKAGARVVDKARELIHRDWGTKDKIAPTMKKSFIDYLHEAQHA